MSPVPAQLCPRRGWIRELRRPCPLKRWSPEHSREWASPKSTSHSRAQRRLLLAMIRRRRCQREVWNVQSVRPQVRRLPLSDEQSRRKRESTGSRSSPELAQLCRRMVSSPELARACLLQPWSHCVRRRCLLRGYFPELTAQWRPV
jgi:hypothetical protein